MISFCEIRIKMLEKKKKEKEIRNRFITIYNIILLSIYLKLNWLVDCKECRPVFLLTLLTTITIL